MGGWEDGSVRTSNLQFYKQVLLPEGQKTRIGFWKKHIGVSYQLDTVSKNGGELVDP
jgi:hypothetical protein